MLRRAIAPAAVVHVRLDVDVCARAPQLAVPEGLEAARPVPSRPRRLPARILVEPLPGAGALPADQVVAWGEDRCDRVEFSRQLRIRRVAVVVFEEYARWLGAATRLREQIENRRRHGPGMGVVIETALWVALNRDREPAGLLGARLASSGPSQVLQGRSNASGPILAFGPPARGVRSAESASPSICASYAECDATHMRPYGRVGHSTGSCRCECDLGQDKIATGWDLRLSW